MAPAVSRQYIFTSQNIKRKKLVPKCLLSVWWMDEGVGNVIKKVGDISSLFRISYHGNWAFIALKATQNLQIGNIG